MTERAVAGGPTFGPMDARHDLIPADRRIVELGALISSARRNNKRTCDLRRRSGRGPGRGPRRR